MDAASDWYSSSVPVIIYVISCKIGPRYNDTRLYVACTHKTQMSWKLFWRAHQVSLNTLYVLVMYGTNDKLWLPTMKTTWVITRYLRTRCAMHQANHKPRMIIRVQRFMNETMLFGVVICIKLLTQLNEMSTHITSRTRNVLHLGIKRFNTLRPEQNGCHFEGNIFKSIFFNEDCCILILISLKLITKCPIDNKSASIQVMAWCQTGNKPSSVPRLTQIYDGTWHH